MKISKVLIVATSRKTRGGITEVVKAHELGFQWKKHHCKWIQTHVDSSPLRKLLYMGVALLEYVVLLPFYDIVHIHMATKSSVYRKLLFVWLAKILHKKLIVHFHPPTEKDLFLPISGSVCRYIFRTADKVLVLSEQWKNWIKQAYNVSNNVTVLYNPCPTVCQVNVEKKKQILFAGTIILRKGYDVVLHAFAQIANKYPEWNLVFAGNGEIERAKAICNGLGISNQVQFLGWITGKDKELTFGCSSIYCLASDGEGFPMGVLDAWAYRIPCIVTPVGGITDIIVNNKNGVIFEVGNVEQLAAGLEKLILHKDIRDSIVKETDTIVNSIFNLTVICTELDHIYSTI